MKKSFVALFWLFFGNFFVSCSDYDEDDFKFPIVNGVEDSGDGSTKAFIFFPELKIGEITDIIYSARNFLIEDKKRDGKQFLRISPDLGKTWKEFENPYGDLVYFHIFSTGDMLFATTQWCYYIDSGLNAITPSEVFDYGGEVFVPEAIEHFYQIGSCKNYICQTGGAEVVVWGDYNLEKNDPNYIPRVWYSADYGRTVKCAIRFDKTRIDSKVIKCRHTYPPKCKKASHPFWMKRHCFSGESFIVSSEKESGVIESSTNTVSEDWTETEFSMAGIKYKLNTSYRNFEKNNTYMRMKQIEPYFVVNST